MKSLGTVFLLLAVALAGCTSEDRGDDRDGDGLEDSLERTGWSSQVVEFMDRRVEVAFTSDPGLVDTDGDGLTDREEFFIRSDPSEKDTDGDGLTDCQEARHTNVTECETPGFDLEADGDGGYGTDPRKADSDPGPSMYKETQPFTFAPGTGQEGEPRFGDGISDGEEVTGFWVPFGDGMVRAHTDPRQTDTDQDGLEDGEETFLFGSLPHVHDSDGDGCKDSTDPWPAIAGDPQQGLDRLVLTNAPGQTADLRLTVLFYDEVRSFTVDAPMQAGDEWDLRPLDERVPIAEHCTLPIRDPWTRVQLIVYDRETQQNLDFSSFDGVGHDGIWWNAREDVFSLERRGATWHDGGPVELSGVHGSVRFEPFLAT